jgi:hypothetical protein
LVRLLGWSVKEKQHQRSSRAPSWSWASLDGPALFHTVYGPDAVVINPRSFPVYEEREGIPLSCRLLRDEKVIREILRYIRKDLAYDEYPAKQIQCLLLGTDGERAGRYADGIGLAIIEVAPGIFRRIGLLAVYGQKHVAALDKWFNPERHDIILV